MIDINELRRLAQANYESNSVDSLYALQDAFDYKTVLELLDRLEAAENENAKLHIALAEKITSETTLRDLRVVNGSINATFEGGAVQLMVDALADRFVESGAPNYIEMQFHGKATGPLLFTLQRVDGKTPHQLRAEAEQERDALRAEVQTWQEQAKAYWSKIEQMERQEPFDADRPEFRRAFDAALKTGNWPTERQNFGYRSPMSQMAWQVAFCTVNNLKLYLAPGAKGE